LPRRYAANRPESEACRTTASACRAGTSRGGGAKTEEGGKPRGKHGFEGEWADQASKYADKLDGMSSEKWDQVYAAVAPFVKGSSASSGALAEQSDDDGSDGIVISSDEGD